MPSKIKLTTTAVDRLREVGIYWDTQTPGLGVRVSDSGRKTYFLKRRVKGGSRRECNVALGRHGDPVLIPDGSARTFPYGVDDARKDAAPVIAKLLAGIDPVQQRKDAEAAAVAKAEKDKALATTLRETLAMYLERPNRPLRPAYRFNLKQSIEGNFNDWLDKPVASLTKDMCVTKLQAIESRYPKQIAKITQYLCQLLNYAREHHSTDEGYPILAVNPVVRAKRVTKPQKPKARSNRLPIGKVGAAWAVLRKRAANPVRDLDRTQADWVSVILLTGCREGESAALRWEWFDWQAKTFTIPGDLDIVTDNPRLFVGTKTHVPLTVPMSDVLHDLLKARFEDEKRHPVYVFPAGRSDSEIPYVTTARGPLLAIKHATGVHVSLHDLRRTTVSVAIECRVDYSLRLRLLNHSAKTVHDDYERDNDPETMRPTMNAIAKFLADAAVVAEAQASGANVINITDRRTA